MAAESEDMQIEMELEDDYFEELRDKERQIVEDKKAIEEQRKALEKLKK
jgi:hypothetical protein